VKLVFRFAGASLDTPLRVRAAAARMRSRAEDGDSVAAVVGHPSSRNSRLVRHLDHLGATVASTEREVVRGVAAAEQVTACLLAAQLVAEGQRATSLDAREAGLGGVGDFAHGRLSGLDPARVGSLWSGDVVPVICGGHAVRRDGELVSLGPSGADLTAVVLAELLGAACHFVLDRNRLDLAARDRHLIDPAAVDRARTASVPLFIYSYRSLGDETRRDDDCVAS